MVGIQESRSNIEADVGCKVGEYAWIGKQKKGQEGWNR